ncbi:MAG: DEAD/DEAH box helicase [Myxococcota bacterium]|nr:DEAD/DEAH box helicase [Myxococcota bacterium]
MSSARDPEEPGSPTSPDAALRSFRRPTRDWFRDRFPAPTLAQELGWPPMARRESVLLLAPTGSGKTLAAFLGALDRLLFDPVPDASARCRVVYVSPLKALAVDVERNLRSPLLGIAAAARARDVPCHLPVVHLRTGDTPPQQRSHFTRGPTDLLVTTPESLYLLLTSRARERLRAVQTVIVDEIHALVPSKRGSHLALSLERLEALAGRPLQRIGLSATQRPLAEVARFLGGWEPAPVDPAAPRRPRPVTVVDAGSRKPLRLRVEVPAATHGWFAAPSPGSPAAQRGEGPSSWHAILPRLRELVGAHQATLVFVNNRRVAERVAAAVNELAGEPLLRAHHGSLARAQRQEIESLLKAGRLRGVVATSSLELGIDMGAVDLVVQLEAPRSIASGLQRIGRAGHQVGAVSEGVLFPKHRADLLACVAAVEGLHAGDVEPVAYPRNPLDVLAQQVVAEACAGPVQVADLFARVRQAAPYAELSAELFTSLLDLLSGRYASTDFAELRPRLTWDRHAGTVTAREGARLLAVGNAGTIPDRGLYGVFLVGGEGPAQRVGELDEEQVFESRPGETFVLGASSWRIAEITHDRVLVTPAPGEPGRLPFWHGERAARSLSLGRRIGRLVRELGGLPRAAARQRLAQVGALDPAAADELLAFLDEQRDGPSALPDDETLVIERLRDQGTGWRLLLLSPFGARVHLPWALAAAGLVRRRLGLHVETLPGDEGFVLRLPELAHAPDAGLLLPEPGELEELLRAELGGSSLFAARFRESAARALLLPRGRPGRRMPLWLTRKRALDLLQVAARDPTFPLILETYRECLADWFDLPALQELLADIHGQRLRVVVRDTTAPSPFAASMLFGYAAAYLYDGDRPLAEARAQALTVDPARLRELLGEPARRQLLDPAAVAWLGARLQGPGGVGPVRGPDGLHDLLLRLGDLTPAELQQRAATPDAADWLASLLAAGRVLAIGLAGEQRLIAVEDAARYRDAWGVTLPDGLPPTLLLPAVAPRADLVLRYARTHPPFPAAELAARFGVAEADLQSVLPELVGDGRLLAGEFLPGGAGLELCHPEVFRVLRQRSLERLRREVEPVPAAALSRLQLVRQGVSHPRPGRTPSRQGLDGLLDTCEQLQGVPLVISELETEILPARVAGYSPLDLDALFAAGELVWVGVEPLGARDGRIALYLTDGLRRLWRPPRGPAGASGGPASRLLDLLRQRGAAFFEELHGVDGGFPGETLRLLWELVWCGLVTNDSLLPVRGRIRPRQARGPAVSARGPYRSRRTLPPEAAGRWALVEARAGGPLPDDTQLAAALAERLLALHGVVAAGTTPALPVPGGLASLLEVLSSWERAGRLGRGLFVAGLGGLQFATTEAVEGLRGLREPPDTIPDEAPALAASDPANPYGLLLPWPEPVGRQRGRPSRSAGARVLLVHGELAAWVGRGGRQVLLWLPDQEPARTGWARAVAAGLAELARRAHARVGGRAGFAVVEIDGGPARQSPLAPLLTEVGFGWGPGGACWTGGR